MNRHAMDKRLVEAVVHFEVHILMTMKLRIKMSHEEAKLEAKLAEQGISLSNAEHIHKRIAGALGDEESYFVNLKRLLGIPGQDPELRYDSIVWPGFEFRAVLGSDGCVESAQYWHSAGNPLKTGDPSEVPIWSIDV